MTCCIYKLTSPSGKCYIGQSINFDRRILEHKNVANKKKSLPKLYQAFKKYGFENFQIEILEECDSELLNEREIYWINYYDSCNIGYNCTTGGDSKFSRSKETKEKLSKYFTGVYNGSQNIPFTIDEIEYSSIGVASKQLGIPAKTIHNRLNSKNIKFDNYKYVNNELNVDRRPPKYDHVKIECIIDGIKYESIKEASEKLNINHSTLAYRIRKSKQ